MKTVYDGETGLVTKPCIRFFAFSSDFFTPIAVLYGYIEPSSVVCLFKGKLSLFFFLALIQEIIWTSALHEGKRDSPNSAA